MFAKSKGSICSPPDAQRDPTQKVRFNYEFKQNKFVTLRKRGSQKWVCVFVISVCICFLLFVYCICCVFVFVYVVPTKADSEADDVSDNASDADVTRPIEEMLQQNSNI